MMTAAIAKAVAEIDRIMATPKTLEGGHPRWSESPRPRLVEAKWNVLDDLGAVVGHLRFTLGRDSVDEPTVQMIVLNEAVARVDVKPDTECKPNDISAAELGLPAVVCGTHGHFWEDNREYVLRAGFGSLPVRRPLPSTCRQLHQAMYELVDRINLTLTPEQRRFEIPPRKFLI